MVGRAADFNGLHSILSGDAAYKWPKPVPERRRDCRLAFFRAEHAMEIGAHVRHAAHSAVPSGLVQYGIGLPTLKRWAILSSPSGTQKPLRFEGRKSFLMVTVLPCTLAIFLE